MTLHKPLWAQNENYSAMNDRGLISAVFGEDGVVVKGLKVSQRGAGANMSVDVSAGTVVCPGPLGSYLCHSDAVENVVIGVAPAVGTSRRDLIYAEVVDPQAMGSGATVEWSIKALAGTAAASNPALPATPAWSVALAEVLVTSDTTSVLDSAITHFTGATVRAFDVSLEPGVQIVLSNGVYEQIVSKTVTVTSPCVAAISVLAGYHTADEAGNYDWRARIQVDNADHPVDASAGLIDGWAVGFGGTTTGRGHGAIADTIFWPLAIGTHTVDLDVQVSNPSAGSIQVQGAKLKVWQLGTFGPS